MAISNTGVTYDPLEVVPTVGMSGLYTLKEPYTGLLRPQVEYSCIAVINLSGALAAGEDPLNDVYLANGDTEASYQADLDANHCLVTLKSGTGDVIQVPNSALSGLPSADGIRYVSMMLGISLSALPADFDLTQLKQTISDVVFDSIGVRSTVFPGVVGSPIVLTHAQHEQIEAGRLANATAVLSDRAKVLKLQQERQALLDKIAVLEAYLVDNLP